MESNFRKPLSESTAKLQWSPCTIGTTMVVPFTRPKPEVLRKKCWRSSSFVLRLVSRYRAIAGKELHSRMSRGTHSWYQAQKKSITGELTFPLAESIKRMSGEGYKVVLPPPKTNDKYPVLFGPNSSAMRFKESPYALQGEHERKKISTHIVLQYRKDFDSEACKRRSCIKKQNPKVN